MISDRKEDLCESFSDRKILDFLRRQGASTINDLMQYAGVTATAIRLRVNRLMKQGLVVRRAETRGRGRPTHCYSLSATGVRSTGDNFQDLASALWTEIRSIDDSKVRRGLLKRIADRLVENYGGFVEGANLREKMKSLVSLMQERDVPFETSGEDSKLPVLTAWACPYPELAELDRSICSVEKLLFSELLGEPVRLSSCRLDGDSCCTFEAGHASTATN